MHMQLVSSKQRPHAVVHAGDGLTVIRALMECCRRQVRQVDGSQSVAGQQDEPRADRPAGEARTARSRQNVTGHCAHARVRRLGGDVNVYVLHRWKYGSGMPVIAGIDTLPLVQWLILPPLILWLVPRSLACDSAAPVVF